MTPTRVVCKNTLNMALEGATRSWSARHVGNISKKVSEAQRTLGFVNRYMEELKETATTLYGKKVSKKALEAFKDAMFPLPEDIDEHKGRESANERLRDQFDFAYRQSDLNNCRGTEWGLINAVSDLATHRVPMRRSANYQENLMADAVGSGYPLIDKAFEILMAA
jgi:hypothetical protein